MDFQPKFGLFVLTLNVHGVFFSFRSIEPKTSCGIAFLAEIWSFSFGLPRVFLLIEIFINNFCVFNFDYSFKMVHMVFVVHNCKTSIRIKKSWIWNLDEADAFNNGLNTGKDYKIFYSVLDDTLPNFLLPVSNRFDPSKDACYMARFKRSYNEKEACETYLSKQRKFFPVVYNSKRAKLANVKSDMELRLDAVLEVKIEQTDGNKKMQQAINKLLEYAPPIDLTDEEIADYQQFIGDETEDEEMAALMFEVDSNESELEPSSTTCENGQATGNVETMTQATANNENVVKMVSYKL